MLVTRCAVKCHFWVHTSTTMRDVPYFRGTKTPFNDLKKINPILFQFWDTWRLQECDEINLFARIERMSILCIHQHFTHLRPFWGSFWVINAPFSQQMEVFMTILCLNVYLLLKSFKRRCHLPMSIKNANSRVREGGGGSIDFRGAVNWP